MEVCENCHESNTPDEAKAKELARQVPKLCFSCHEDESQTFAYVHGPVAVGQCLFCHDPHKSEHLYLLKRSPSELCALCHTQTDLASITDHLKPSHVNCLECHTSHASNERFLLREIP
jgi:predicted CXXCH cytochrome family protein